MWHQTVDQHGRPYWVNMFTGQATYQLQQGGGLSPQYANPVSPGQASPHMGMGHPTTGMAYSPTQGPSYDMTGSSFASTEGSGELSRTARHVTQAAAFTLLFAGAAKKKIMPTPWGHKGRRQHLARTFNNAKKMGSPGKL